MHSLDETKEGRQRPVSGVSHCPCQILSASDENTEPMHSSDVTSLMLGLYDCS